MKTLEQSSHFSQNMVDLLNVRPFNALIMYQIMGHKRKEMITNMRQGSIPGKSNCYIFRETSGFWKLYFGKMAGSNFHMLDIEVF